MRLSDNSCCGEEPTRLAPQPSDPTLAPRPLTEEERGEAWRAANFYDATSDNAGPIALWILGPSSVGKSTLTAAVGHEFGIPQVPAEEGSPHPQPSLENSICSEEDVRRCLDAVIVDGEFMRDAHALWQQWVRTDDWRSAYPELKAIINREKDRMQEAAVAERKHLVIPQTMLNLGKGLTDLARLVGQGYTNHVLAVIAPLEECRRRGRVREVSTGKRYQSSEFEQSIQAIPPMVAACNGRYQLIRAMEQNEGSKQRMGYRVLATGPCGSGSSFSLHAELNTPSFSFDAEYLSGVIEENIRGTSE